MTAAFHFDLVDLLGKALNELVKNGEIKKINYTDCYQFSQTDPEALAQAERFKTVLKQVRYN